METQLPSADCSARHTELSTSPPIERRIETSSPLNLDLITLIPQAFDQGLLSRLPAEVLYIILEELPLRSLFRFRNTNRLAHYLVDNMPKFRIVVEQAPHSIRGILAFQTKVSITLREFFMKLRQRHCDYCGEAAEHLWLPTILRLCPRCAHLFPTPMTKKELRIIHECLTEDDFDSIPSLRFFPYTVDPSIPDHDSDSFETFPELTLYDTQIATEKFYQKNPKFFKSKWLMPSIMESDKTSPLVFINWTGQKSPDPSPGWSGSFRKSCRLNMALIIAPWVSSEGAELEVVCSRCRNARRQGCLSMPDDCRQHGAWCSHCRFDHGEVLITPEARFKIMSLASTFKVASELIM